MIIRAEFVEWRTNKQKTMKKWFAHFIYMRCTINWSFLFHFMKKKAFAMKHFDHFHLKKSCLWIRNPSRILWYKKILFRFFIVFSNQIFKQKYDVKAILSFAYQMKLPILSLAVFVWFYFSFLSFTTKDIKKRFPQSKIICFIDCATIIKLNSVFITHKNMFSFSLKWETNFFSH